MPSYALLNYFLYIQTVISLFALRITNSPLGDGKVGWARFISRGGVDP